MELHLVPEVRPVCHPGYPVGEMPRPIVVVDRRMLVRESLAVTLTCHGRDVEGVAYAWQSAFIGQAVEPVMVLLCGRDVGDVAPELRWLAPMAARCRVLVVSDTGDAAAAVGALREGAHGFISATASLDALFVAIEAVEEGGTYAPAECLTQILCGGGGRRHGDFRPSARQVAILEAVRQGKPDKVIAAELGVSTATVKIGVKNLRERFGARNRTELAYKYGFPEELGEPDHGPEPRRKSSG